VNGLKPDQPLELPQGVSDDTFSRIVYLGQGTHSACFALEHQVVAKVYFPTASAQSIMENEMKAHSMLDLISLPDSESAAASSSSSSGIVSSSSSRFCFRRALGKMCIPFACGSIFLLLLEPVGAPLSFNRNLPPFLNEEKFLTVGKQLLDSIHRAGWTHRDVKPSNFLILAHPLYHQLTLNDFSSASRSVGAHCDVDDIAALVASSALIFHSGQPDSVAFASIKTKFPDLLWLPDVVPPDKKRRRH
jgi:hypothetical protein